GPRRRRVLRGERRRQHHEVHADEREVRQLALVLAPENHGHELQRERRSGQQDPDFGAHDVYAPAFSRKEPTLRNLPSRGSGRLPAGSAATAESSRATASATASAAASGSRCAPPAGSCTTESAMPSSSRSLAVIFISRAAVSTFFWSFHKIDAQPSGEMTL